MLLLTWCLMHDENPKVKKKVPSIVLSKVLNPVVPIYCLSALNPSFLAIYPSLPRFVMLELNSASMCLLSVAQC